VPTDALPAAAELLAEAVREPAFDEPTVTRVRDERIDELALELSQPGSRAAAAFAAEVFADGTRYARPDGGDLTTVPGIAPDVVRRFHAERFTPGNATLLIVGDLTGVDAAAVARTVFGGWTGAAATPADPVVAPRARGRRIVLVDRPGSVQSMLYVGHDGPPRAIPDYVPTTTMALTLGGMFNSRLNYRLREDKGYTYGAFGGFDFRRHGGVFAARAAVQTDVTGAALGEMVKEIAGMHDAGVTDEELDRARRYRAGIFPINFAGAGPVASGLGDLVVHGFADDHFDRLREQILQVTKAEIDEAAATRLRPDDFVCVVVGDASVVGDDVRAAVDAPVEVVADEG
jgi:zinc protease